MTYRTVEQANIAKLARPAVRDKADMYRRLAAGEFGNTVPQYLSVAAWKASGDNLLYPMWGVRSATQSMHPACRLYCPANEVEAYAAEHFPDGVNISMMVDAVAGVEAWLEVFESVGGLRVEGVIRPKVHEGWTWRNSMPMPSRRMSWTNSAAIVLLRSVLNNDSYADLRLVLDMYPSHVVEITALDRCLGRDRLRNGIVWEVRAY